MLWPASGSKLTSRDGHVAAASSRGLGSDDPALGLVAPAHQEHRDHEASDGVLPPRRQHLLQRVGHVIGAAEPRLRPGPRPVLGVVPPGAELPAHRLDLGLGAREHGVEGGTARLRHSRVERAAPPRRVLEHRGAEAVGVRRDRPGDGDRTHGVPHRHRAVESERVRQGDEVVGSAPRCALGLTREAVVPGVVRDHVMIGLERVGHARPARAVVEQAVGEDDA